MKPITFSCEETLAMPPEQIAGRILELTRWPEFRGYGVLPGIKAAEFEVRTPGVVGSRIRVTNADGSSHLEEVVEWEPDRRLRLRLGEFASPLARLSDGFDETWQFERLGDDTRVVRTFELHARNLAGRPLLWMISRLLREAIARHLRQMRDAAVGGVNSVPTRPETPRGTAVG